MTGAIPPPPRINEYIVLGSDGRQHHVSLHTLRNWAADGRITAAYQVFSHSTGAWALAGELPELRDVWQSGGGGNRPVGNQKISGCGCVALGAAILLLVLLFRGGTDSSSDQPAATGESFQQTQIGSGNRAVRMNQVVSQLSPLFESWEETGPASVHVQVNPQAWNSLTRDQQQQLMDELASKQIVRDIGATIHLHVLSTEVGAIHRGLSGEYKFRRTSE